MPCSTACQKFLQYKNKDLCRLQDTGKSSWVQITRRCGRTVLTCSSRMQPIMLCHKIIAGEQRCFRNGSATIAQIVVVHRTSIDAGEDCCPCECIPVSNAFSVLYIYFYLLGRHKYLLYMSGNTWSARLKMLLLCKSTLIMPFDVHQAFWWHLLEAGYHYVSIDTLEAGTSADRLQAVVEVSRRKAHPTQLPVNDLDSNKMSHLYNVSPNLSKCTIVQIAYYITKSLDVNCN